MNLPTTIPPTGDLTPTQEAFASAYVLNGGKATDAALEAGYAEGSARVRAYELLKKPHVIKRIYELTVSSLGTHIPAALATVARLSGSARSEYVQLEASKDLLDRAGMSAPKQVNVSGSFSVEIDLS